MIVGGREDWGSVSLVGVELSRVEKGKGERVWRILMFLPLSWFDSGFPLLPEETTPLAILKSISVKSFSMPAPPTSQTPSPPKQISFQ